MNTTKPCICTKCNREFTNHFGLNAHMTSHNIESKKRCYEALLRNGKHLRKNAIDKYEKNPKLCIYCSNTIPYDKKLNKFCSHVCSAKYSNKNREYKSSDDKRTKIIKCIHCGGEMMEHIRSRSNKCKKCKKQYKFIRCCKERTCIICNNKYKTISNRKTCSDNCRNKYQQKLKQTLYENGFINNAPGRCKKITYTSNTAGIVHLDGTWELEAAKYFDKMNFKWKRNTERFKYIFENTEHYYTPDFFIEDWNCYIEIKGYETDKDRCKWTQFPLNIKIWKHDKIKQITKINAA